MKTKTILLIVGLVLGLPCCGGCLVAIAVPNFIRFQARSKQSECKTQLKQLVSAEAAYFEAHNRYAGDFKTLGLPVSSVRYAYFLSAGSISSEAGKVQPELGLSRVSGLREQLAVNDDNYFAACIGNVDADDSLDVWVVSNRVVSLPNATSLRSGEVTAWFDDVLELGPAAGAKSDLVPSAGTAEADSAPPDDEEELKWSVHSGAGNAELTQAPEPSGKCRLQCSVDAKPIWSATAKCLAKRAEWKFLGADCERLIALDPAPKRGTSWRTAVVMNVYRREKLDYPVKGAGVIADEKVMQRSQSWVKGCMGVPGEPPRYSTDGNFIEIDAVDGKHHRVSLLPGR